MSRFTPSFGPPLRQSRLDSPSLIVASAGSSKNTNRGPKHIEGTQEPREFGISIGPLSRDSHPSRSRLFQRLARAPSRGGWSAPDWLAAAAASDTVVPDTGHLLMLESPGLFAQAITSRLA